MTAREQGILLLCCSLGDERVHPLTVKEFLDLEIRTLAADQTEGEVTEEALHDLGLEQKFIQRILELLNRERWLDAYLAAAERLGIWPVTRLSEGYPRQLLEKLRSDAPAVLFLRGDRSLLQKKGVSLVGSRELSYAGDRFARTVGALAAQEGYVLFSGGARGADSAAQQTCLRQGGGAFLFVADRLRDHIPEPNTLYCSAEGYECAFSAQRAHARNRLIHAMGEKTFVAQARLGKGGTWSGATENLRLGLSPVFCHADGSEAARALEEQGAVSVRLEDLHSLQALQPTQLAMNDF